MKIFRHNDLKNSAMVIKSGGIVIYPTDTIWGLGCNALDETATKKLKALKGKPADAQLIWLLPSVESVTKFCGAVTPLEKKLLRQKHTSVIVHGQAVRVVKSGWVNKFLTACGVPVIGTSANLHGQPVVSSWRQATQLFDGKTDAVIRGRKIYQNTPSTLVKVVDGNVQILRQGAGKVQ